MARLTRKHREEQILCNAYELAREKGLYAITSRDVADAVGCSHALVVYYFTSMVNLRDKIIQRAILREGLGILAQAITMRDPAVAGISDDLRERVRRHA